MKKYVKIWYNSLKQGNPDYSVYGAEYYIEALICFIVYSREYIKTINKTTIMISENNILNNRLIANEIIIIIIKSI